jgi:hypothetical protein
MPPSTTTDSTFPGHVAIRFVEGTADVPSGRPGKAEAMGMSIGGKESRFP